MCASRRSAIASPIAACTVGSAVLSVFGVFTGSFASNGCDHGDVWPDDTCAQKRRQRSAPFDVESSRLSQPARASQALPVSTGPLLLGALPLKLLHIAT